MTRAAAVKQRAVAAAIVAGWLLLVPVAAGCGDGDGDGTGAVTTDSIRPAPSSTSTEPDSSSTSTEPDSSPTSTEPDSSSTSTEPQSSTSSTAMTSTTPSTVVGELVAANNGLTLVSFGDEAEGAILVLTGVLGSPDVDTGWQDPSDPASELWPGCPGGTARVLQWTGNLGAVFTDWNGDLSTPGGSVSPPYFAGYGLWPTTSIRTVDGTSPGMTLAQARAVYGERLRVSDRPDDAVELYSFAIDGTGSPLTRIGPLRGWLFPPATDSDTPTDSPSDDWIIDALTAGVSCSTP